MEFCNECGTRMKITKTGYSCPKCGNFLQTRTIEVKNMNHSHINSIYIIDDKKELGTKVNRVCPKCENDQAYHWLSSIIGEHAGVTQERTLKNYKCTKCLHTWGESY